MGKHARPVVLITGSAGFMGSHLQCYLMKYYGSKYDIHGVDDLSGGFLRNIPSMGQFTKLDLRDRVKTSRYIKKLKPEIVFHLAADATEGRSQFTPHSAFDRNLTAYMNVLVPAIKSGLKKVVLVSSMSVYGKQQVPFRETLLPIPEDIYGIAKTAMEQATKVLSSVYGFTYLVFRPHNVYGPKQNLSDPYRNVIGIFINRLLQEKKFYIYGNGQQKRAFSYIDDVIPPMAKITFENKIKNETFNIGSDEAITLNQLSNLILKEYFGPRPPKTLRPIYLPSRPQEVKFAFCDHGKINHAIHCQATTKIDLGLKQTIAWARSIGPQPFNYLDEFDLDHIKIPKTWTKKIY